MTIQIEIPSLRESADLPQLANELRMFEDLDIQVAIVRTPVQADTLDGGEYLPIFIITALNAPLLAKPFFRLMLFIAEYLGEKAKRDAKVATAYLKNKKISIKIKRDGDKYEMEIGQPDEDTLKRLVDIFEKSVAK